MKAARHDGTPYRDVALSAQQITARYLDRLERSLRAEARREQAQGNGEGAYSAAQWAERCQELKRFVAERLIPCEG
jgi:hypothetical protein